MKRGQNIWRSWCSKCRQKRCKLLRTLVKNMKVTKLTHLSKYYKDKHKLGKEVHDFSTNF